MAVCSHCHQRKAKRHCPALALYLCPLCCGLLRVKKIHCPPSCSFLAQHQPYQEKKILAKKQTFSEEILRDERLSWLVLHIEAPLKEYAERSLDFCDKDAVLALEYAREKVEKERSRLVLPKEEIQPRKEAGEAVFLSLDQCRYQRKIILPQDIQTYKKEEKLKCLENVILAVKFLARENVGGRNYCQDLIQRFAKIKNLSRQTRILPSA